MHKHKEYVRELRKAFGFQATWFPDSEVRLGDIGVFRDGQFERKASLEEWGIGYQPRVRPGASPLYEHRSEGAVDVSSAVTAAGGAPAVTAGGGIDVRFTRADAVLFRAVDCWSEEIENIAEIEAEMKERHRKKKWPGRHAVVTEVVHAGWTTVLISDSRTDSARLRTTADATALGWDALTARARLEWTGGSGVSTRILSQGELTPLYRARGVLRRPFGGPSVRFMDEPGPGPAEAAQPGDPYVSDVDSETFALDDEHDEAGEVGADRA
ncbi:hypothetical protein [Streptomyces sp. NPDC101166]|uniref:hypothetical protein n=1 Tax=Streptomyces sp. NPDC101166 TaxID=3366120 RepID=UPI00382DCF02